MSLSVLLYVVLIFNPNKAIRTTINKMKKRDIGEYVCSTSFERDSIAVKNITDGSSIYVSYEKPNRLIETSNYFFLTLEPDQFIPVFKNDLSDSQVIAFSTLIKVRCKNML